jgi:cytoskeleton protein RodZ
MTGHDIGGRVRLAREQRGLTLADASRVTKLPTAVLQAIEHNDFARLPAGMYRKAYLRTFAGEVGLDPREIAADYETQYEAHLECAAAAGGSPARRGRMHLSQRHALVVVILVALLLAAWFVMPRFATTAARRAPPEARARRLHSSPATVILDAFERRLTAG